MSKSLNFNNDNHLESKIFLDDSGTTGIARYETSKYPKISKLVLRQHGFFWTPEEIDLSKDKRDFRELSESDQHIFTSNLFRQTMLDTIQGRAPSLAFLPICSNPEVENFILYWSMFEAIHSRSYTHIIRNLYANPSETFDRIAKIPEIVACAESISKYYDELIELNAQYQLTGKVTYEHKVAIWKTLMSVNALEGIRFYLSFACSWGFGELKKMVGNASIISLISRDEDCHLSFTQTLLTTLPKDDPDFAKIKKQFEGECTKIYIDVIEQEKDWSKYLFKYGAMVGLNERIANQYVEWLSVRKMASVGLTSPYKGSVTHNPIPWINSWMSSENRQTANQETENISYLVGALKPDTESIDPKKDLCFNQLFKEA